MESSKKSDYDKSNVSPRPCHYCDGKGGWFGESNQCAHCKGTGVEPEWFYKFDISKIAPLPWKMDKTNGSPKDGEWDWSWCPWVMVDANGEHLDSEWDTENYIVHCVNMHDELVAALEWFINEVHKNNYFEGDDGEAHPDWVKAQDALARAKGES